MATSVKLSENIVSDARISSKAFNRSIASQIEYWARIGKIAEENPNLNYELIKDLLIAKEEAKNGNLTPYKIDEQ
ncbi:ParD-like family protein [Candidatus Babeliales bacterium]|nr:ParD-like family protein [Candidatus Babeliales bacterium]